MIETATVKIIPAAWKHYALLADLGSKTFYETFANDNTAEDMNAYLAKIYSIEKMQENLKNPAIKYFVAYDELKDAGYIKLIHDVIVDGLTGKVIELEKIYIRQELIGAGFGAALMKQAIEYAQLNNFKHLYLGVWQDNEKAINFYKKFGFKIFNTRKFVLGKRVCDDYLMSIDL